MEEGLQSYGEEPLSRSEIPSPRETPSDVFAGKSPIDLLKDPDGRAAIRATHLPDFLLCQMRYAWMVYNPSSLETL